MKLYKLSYVMYDPSESTEDDKYMAEIPDLPGCRAWGDTPAETLDILQSLAVGFIELYAEFGRELAPAVKSAEVVPAATGAMLVPVHPVRAGESSSGVPVSTNA